MVVKRSAMLISYLKVLSSIPATSKLFSREPASIKICNVSEMANGRTNNIKLKYTALKGLINHSSLGWKMLPRVYSLQKLEPSARAVAGNVGSSQNSKRWLL